MTSTRSMPLAPAIARTCSVCGVRPDCESRCGSAARRTYPIAILRSLARLKKLLATPYYHISLSTDVIGVECAVAMKNCYALGVSLAAGLEESKHGVGCAQTYNPQAALFGQSVKEMARLLKLLGGKDESLVYAAGDLYVTIFGGRTRKLGTLLGRGLPFARAMEELAGITLESVAITTTVARVLRRLAAKGKARLSDFPLLIHIDEIINYGATVAIPWESFVQSSGLKSPGRQ